MMSMLSYSPLPALKRLAQRFGKAREGVAAVEFALIVPIMITLLIGAVELSQAITVDRRVTQIGSSTGDLVARVDKNISKNEISDIMNIGSWLMEPYNSAGTKITIRVITSSATDVNDKKQKWYCTFNSDLATPTDCFCPNTAFTTLPNGLMGAGDSVVVAEVEYAYKPLVFKTFMAQTHTEVAGAFPIKDTVYLKPRAACPRLNKSTPYNANPAAADLCGC